MKPLHDFCLIKPDREEWEEDFYQVLPIVCSPLTADSKVARIKKIFEKLLVAEYERGRDEGLDNRDFGAVISQVRSTALEEAKEAIGKLKRWVCTIREYDKGDKGSYGDEYVVRDKELKDALSSLHALKEKK